MSETKFCPYCGEEIMAVAKKCKHCGEWLDNKSDSITLNTQSSVNIIPTLVLSIITSLFICFGINAALQILYYNAGVELYSFFETLPMAILISAIILIIEMVFLIGKKDVITTNRISLTFATLAMGGPVGILLLFVMLKKNMYDNLAYDAAMHSVCIGSVIAFVVLAIVALLISLKLKSSRSCIMMSRVASALLLVLELFTFGNL